MKKILWLLLIVVCIVGVTDPVSGGNVVVIKSADVDAYRQAIKGLKKVLHGHHKIVKELDMEGDFDLGREFVKEIKEKIKPDLILAVGIWALQVVADQKLNIPTVYAMVLNPPSVPGARAKNITGASMNVPVDLTIGLFKELGPKIRRVGAIFNKGKTGYLVEEAETEAKRQGLGLEARAIRSPGEAIQAIDSLRGKIDILWILPDATILAPVVVQYMLLFSYRNKVPILGLSERQARMGAVLSLSFGSSQDIGRQAGELAKLILEGKTMPEYTMAEHVKLAVNFKAARKLELEIPKSVREGRIPDGAKVRISIVKIGVDGEQ